MIPQNHPLDSLKTLNRNELVILAMNHRSRFGPVVVAAGTASEPAYKVVSGFANAKLEWRSVEKLPQTKTQTKRDF